MNDWVISCADARASVSAFRGVVTSWIIERDGVEHELIDGYCTEAEMQSLDGYRGALMAQWSNRISDARFTFENEEFDLGVDPSGLREGLHGLYASATFSLVRLLPDSVTIEAEKSGSTRVSVAYQVAGYVHHSGRWKARAGTAVHKLF